MISVFSWLRGMKEMNPKMNSTVQYSFIFHLIHPWKLTWNTKMKVWKMIFSFKQVSPINRRFFGHRSQKSQPSRHLVEKRCKMGLYDGYKWSFHYEWIWRKEFSIIPYKCKKTASLIHAGQSDTMMTLSHLFKPGNDLESTSKICSISSNDLKHKL